MTDQLVHDLTVHHVPADEVQEYPGNARQGDVEAIVDSMEENGVFAPIVVQRSTGYVIDGNHRLKAMLQRGEETIPVVYVDVDDERAKRIVLAANRTNDLASYDEQALVELLTSLPDLDGTGYADDDLAALLALTTDHDYEGDDLQDALNESDRAGWPTIKVQIAPASKDQFDQLPGETDEAKFYYLLEQI